VITALMLSGVPLNNETPSNGEDENPPR